MYPQGENIATDADQFGRLAMRPLFFPLVIESRANATPNIILSRSRGGARESLMKRVLVLSLLLLMMNLRSLPQNRTNDAEAAHAGRKRVEPGPARAGCRIGRIA